MGPKLGEGFWVSHLSLLQRKQTFLASLVENWCHQKRLRDKELQVPRGMGVLGKLRKELRIQSM